MAKKISKPFVHPNRIVEAVQQQGNIVPIQQFKVLFPIWDVQIAGEQRESLEYKLLERFVERGIEQGNLHSLGELVRFFQIPEGMLKKMLAYLRNVGHLEDGPDHSLHLTQLAKDSLHDQVFYQPLETHRTLHFAGFTSQPLLRAHYDLNFLTEAESSALKERCQRLYNEENDRLYQEKVFWLAQQPDRAKKYNLPDEIKIKSINAISRSYLPISIIEAHQYTRSRQNTSFTTRYLAISHIQGWHDLFFEEIINSEPAIAYRLQALAGQEADIAQKLEDWIDRRHLNTEARPEQAENGIWRVMIEAESLHQNQQWLARLGIFELEQNYFLQIWCADARVRHEAALAQTLAYAERQRHNQQRLEKTEIERMLKRNATTLHLDPLTWDEMRNYLKKQGKGELSAEMEELSISQ